jgi:hypothetical protein
MARLTVDHKPFTNLPIELETLQPVYAVEPSTNQIDSSFSYDSLNLLPKESLCGRLEQTRICICSESSTKELSK